MSTNSITRICLWSGPRNISTALMYSFAQRKDTKVFDEPLYAYYLLNTKAKEYHPGAKDIMESMENDGEKIVKMMLHNSDNSVLFFKHMTKHLLDLDRSFLKNMVNIILTRNPEEMLRSFAKVISNPSMEDVGYQKHYDLLNYFKRNSIKYVVLDSKNVLQNPSKVLSQLCKFINIPFEKNMLKWDPGAREEDGIWAKYWYNSVHKSTHFINYQEKKVPLADNLRPLLNKCKPIYDELRKYSIG